MSNYHPLPLALLIAAAAACTGGEPQPSYRVDVEHGGVTSTFYGDYDQMVAPLVHPRVHAYTVDGASTTDPAALFAGHQVVAEASAGSLIELNRDGDSLRHDSVALRADTGGVALDIGDDRYAVHITGLDGVELARWRGGVALDLIDGSLDRFGINWSQGIWSVCKAGLSGAGKFCAKHWKKIVGSSGLFATFQFATLALCQSSVIATCANACATACAGGGGGCRSSSGTCSVGVTGATANCTLMCNNGKPAPQQPWLSPDGRPGGEVPAGEVAALLGTCTISEGEEVPCPDDPSSTCVEETECCDCGSDDPLPLPLPTPTPTPTPVPGD